MTPAHDSLEEAYRDWIEAAKGTGSNHDRSNRAEQLEYCKGNLDDATRYDPYDPTWTDPRFAKMLAWYRGEPNHRHSVLVEDV